jgi:hypothetical protein
VVLVHPSLSSCRAVLEIEGGCSIVVAYVC